MSSALASVVVVTDGLAAEVAGLAGVVLGEAVGFEELQGRVRELVG